MAPDWAKVRGLEPASRPRWRRVLTPAKRLWDRLTAAFRRRLRRLETCLLRPRYRCVSAGGFRLYVDMRDAMIGSSIASGAPYEAHLAAVLRKALRPGDTFLDLGANIGYFTMLAASLVGPSGRVIAFEPRHDNVALLRLSARENGFGCVEVHPLAAAEREQAFKYYPHPDNSLSHVVEEARLGSGTSHAVRAVALDEALAGLPRLDVVKMDIDGNEPRALAGMRGLLTRHHPLLFFELAPSCLEQVSRADPEALLEEIRRLGYELRTLGLDGYASPPQTAQEVLAAYRRSGSTHIDLVAYPGSEPAAKAA